MRITPRIVAPLTLALLAGAAAAQPVTFTQWTFNNLASGQINNSPAPSTGHGTAVALGMTNNYEFYTSPHQYHSYTTCDLNNSGSPLDTGAPNNCWRVRGSYDGTLAHAGVGYSIFAPEYTQGAEFDVSTVHFSGISFSFDWFTTNQGVHNMRVQYSTDAGSTWTSIGPVLNSATNAWLPAPVVVDFSAIPAVDNNPNFRVRLVSVYDPTYSGPGAPTYTGASGGQYNNASGNWRFDRITFTGTPISSVDPACSGSVAPTAVCTSGGTLTFSVSVESGYAPTSTGLSVTGDLSGVGLSAAQPFYDDGTHGDPIAGDHVFTYAAAIPAGNGAGPHSITATVTDAQSRSANTTIPFVVGDCSGNSASRVVISQAFGGGGNIGLIPAEDAPYDADFVELFNRSSQTVSLDGWSVQYASQGSSGGFNNTGDQVILSGDIKPGQYVLVRMSDPVPAFNPLPTPDFAQLPGFGGMGNTGGRVALVRSTALIGTNFSDPAIEDLVGYGSGAITFEGAAPTATPNPVNATGVIRKSGGTQDSNQNFNDFTIGTPNAHNRASGGFLAGYASESADAVCAGSSVLFTVQTSPAPNSTGIGVSADVSAIVGSASVVQLFDDGSHGDAHAGDGIFSLEYSVPGTAAQGVRQVSFTVSDQQGNTDTSSLILSVGYCADSGAPVVISQVYGGGGNDASGYNGDFAELFNRSAYPVDLTGWSFQSARITDLGFDSRICLLSGVINPGEYRLIVTNQLSATGAALPGADFTPDTLFGMESSFGRVVLVSSTDLVHTDYTRSDVVDLVGYGSATQSFEGVAPTGTLNDYLVAVRKQNGCQDTNQNAIDFDVQLALQLPRNSASIPTPCACTVSCDYNDDGGADFSDVIDLANDIASGTSSFPQHCKDFNQDGGEDTGDVIDLANAIASATCS